MRIAHTTPWLLLALILLGQPMIGLASDAQEPNRVFHFSTNATRSIDNDTLHLSLYAVAEGDEPSELTQSVNRAVADALAIVKKHPDIKASSNGYNTQPVYNKQREIDFWRVRQGITLSSTKPAELAALTSELQQHVKLERLWYSVSKKQREKVEAELVEEALARFNQRAESITRGLKRVKYDIRRATIHTEGGPMPIKQRVYAESRAFMAADAAAVEAPSGETDLTVRIDGEIVVD